MTKTILKRIGLICIFSLGIFGFSVGVFAQDTLEYTILPKLDEGSIESGNKAIQEIGQTGGHVMDTYNEKANEFTVEQQLATGIMNRNTIIDYLVYVVQFLSQIGLVVGAIFIMIAGYQYMLTVFNFKGKGSPKDYIKNAIIGVIIVVFSYAILKFFTAMFLGS